MVTPWFLLARRRLVVSLGMCVLLVVLMHFWVSAESPGDVGILWHHFCGCPPEPGDARVLMNTPFLLTLITALVMGAGLGIVNTGGAAAAKSGGMTRFLLTRPVGRARVLLAPLVIATGAIAVVPVLASALLLGWLWVVHAPSLGHLLALMQLLPAVAALGPEPKLAAVLGASHFWWRYGAAVAVALSACALLLSQRWLLASTNRKLQMLGTLPFVLWLWPVLNVFGQRVSAAMTLLGPKTAGLGYLPSALGVWLHLAFAVAVVGFCWGLLERTEV